MAALGDAPTAAIAVVAIGLGLFFAVRGPRDKRAPAGAADAGDAPGPAMVTLPTSAATLTEPDREPGFVGPAGDVVGHGPIRLGIHGPLGGAEPAAPEPEPGPAVAAPAPAPASAPAPVAEAPAVAQAAEQADEAPKEPAWRVAARAANSAVHFRQGTIKVGGKPVDERKDP
ncbi:MAG TPA: hypothetical protein VFZ89_19855 [Solirubrobacteraceae bacterium]